MGSDKARPAYVDDVDETSGKAVRGTRRSASTKPKVHRESRPSKPRRSQTESISPTEQSALEVMNREQEMKLERRMSTSGNKSPRKTARPPSSHETRGYPKISVPSNSRRDDQSYYGIPTPTTVSSATTASQPISLAHRPRALTAQTYPRPQSYHSSAQSTYGAHAGPPLSMSAYYQQPQQMVPQQSYPPPQYNVRYAAPLQSVQQTDYFSNQQLVSRPLASRFEMVRSSGPGFDPISRTTSAFGTRDMPSPSDFDDDGYNSASESATIRRPRRQSILRGPPMSRQEADALAMPPPSIPRQGILRRSTDYPIEAPDPEDYRLARSEYPEPTRHRRPSANRHSVSYDLSTGAGRVTLEAANSSRRRSSWYDQPDSTASSGYEQQLSQAANYQEDVTGGPIAPLTAESLRKQQKREVGSSRSTKSSGSRDDSDYKKSATTRTTRSGSGNDDENMTIKVTGQARVMVGGTQIDCTEGSAIEIKREKNIRTGSERSNSVYGGHSNRRIEDGRRTREERPAGRSRMSSSGRSHARKSQQYPPGPDYF